MRGRLKEYPKERCLSGIVLKSIAILNSDPNSKKESFGSETKGELNSHPKIRCVMDGGSERAGLLKLYPNARCVREGGREFTVWLKLFPKER